MKEKIFYKNYIFFTYAVAGEISLIKLFGLFDIYSRIGNIINILGITINLYKKDK